MILAASYDTVADAEADYEAVKELYDAAGIRHSLSAAVLERSNDGKVKVVDKHGDRRATVRGRAWLSAR